MASFPLPQLKLKAQFLCSLAFFFGAGCSWYSVFLLGMAISDEYQAEMELVSEMLVNIDMAICLGKFFNIHASGKF
jgi:hypothetical protein